MRLLNILLVVVSLSSCDFPDSDFKAEFIAPSFLSNYSYSPYMSKDFKGRPLMRWIDKEADLSILKYSVPAFIENNKSLMNIINEIKDASLDDGGGGAFYIFLKKNYLHCDIQSVNPSLIFRWFQSLF